MRVFSRGLRKENHPGSDLGRNEPQEFFDFGAHLFAHSDLRRSCVNRGGLRSGNRILLMHEVHIRRRVQNGQEGPKIQRNRFMEVQGEMDLSARQCNRR